jgi:hypothetical protein
MEEVDEYVKRHPAERLTLVALWTEMDTIWDSFGLDNRKPLRNQPVSEFYAHPVWVVNGLFSAADPESLRHRIAIAQYAVEKLKVSSVANYGGGIGELARQIEHIEDPIGVALRMIEATRFDRHLIFANCFYPVIKCHLPGTFYLRHTFCIVMKAAGLDYVPDCLQCGKHAWLEP